MAATVPAADPIPASASASAPWWLLLFQGIAAVILGVLLLAAPAATLVLMIQLLGAYWLVGGVFSLVSMFVDHSNWGWKLLGGIVAILAGLAVLQHPLWSSVVVPTTAMYLLGFAGLVTGAAALVDAFRGAGWGSGVYGALNILLGLILIGNPVVAAIGVPWVYGTVAVVGGLFTIVSAFSGRGQTITV